MGGDRPLSEGRPKSDRFERGPTSDMLPQPTSGPWEVERMRRTTRRRFADRKQAGRELAGELSLQPEEYPVVLGIPAGGCILAAEVSRILDADLGAVVACKLRAPYQSGLTLGAVTADNVSWVHHGVADEVGASESYLCAEIVRRAKEARRLEREFGSRARPPVHGRTAIVVADGIVTGARALAALRSLVHAGASRALLAAGVGSPEAFERVRGEAFQAVSLEEDPHFVSVGDYFEDFCTVSSGEVLQLLESAAQRLPVC